MSEETYECSGCGIEKSREAFHEFYRPSAKRPVTARCRECRKEDRFKILYPVACKWCGKHRKLEPNAACRACCEDAGLRCCVACGKMRSTDRFPTWHTRRVCAGCRGSAKMAANADEAADESTEPC